MHLTIKYLRKIFKPKFWESYAQIGLTVKKNLNLNYLVRISQNYTI